MPNVQEDITLPFNALLDIKVNSIEVVRRMCAWIHSQVAMTTMPCGSESKKRLLCMLTHLLQVLQQCFLNAFLLERGCASVYHFIDDLQVHASL